MLILNIIEGQLGFVYAEVVVKIVAGQIESKMGLKNCLLS